MQEPLAEPAIDSSSNKRPAAPRLLLLDVMRGGFVLAMIVFHFAWDLSAFGLAPENMMFEPGWRWFGRTILSGFLLISGFSLFWGWRYHFHFPSAMKRFLKIAGAALFITTITYLATPGAFVYFGVLHHIAVGSLILLLLRRSSVVILAALALAAAALPAIATSASFNGPLGWWLGLAEIVRPSNDAVPMFPWFSYMLTGGILARIAPQERMRKVGSMGRIARWCNPLAWAGKHSLLIYLLHQPVIWGILYLLNR